MIPVRSNPKSVDAYAPIADASAGLNEGFASSTLFNRYGLSVTSSRRVTLRNVMALTSAGRKDMNVVQMIDAVIITKNVKPNAEMTLVVSHFIDGRCGKGCMG